MTTKQIIVVTLILLTAGLFLFIMSVMNGFNNSIDEFSASDKQSQSYKPDTLSSDVYMPEDKFWSIIEKSGNADYDQQQKTLETLLSAETPAEIIKFENRFSHLQNRAYDWKLWAAAYIINGGCSDDCFIDFRSWLIGQGRDTFEKALQDPETLVNIPIEPDRWEGIQYVAVDVYEEKTKAQLPVSPVRHKGEPSGKPWQEDELDTLLPKLSKKYN